MSTARRYSVQTSSCRPIPSGGTAPSSPDLPRGTLPRSRTRSAPRNQPTASAREAQNHWADGSRCYGQPRSYLTGSTTIHRLISFRSADGIAGPGSILRPDGDKRMAARSPKPAQRLVPLPVLGLACSSRHSVRGARAEVINREAPTGHEPVWRLPSSAESAKYRFRSNL